MVLFLKVQSFLVSFLLATSVFAAEANIPLTGIYWSPKKDAKMEITEKDGVFSGKFVWLEKPEKKDIENPDAALKDRLVLGMEFLSGFKADGANKWAGGKIYDPKSGKTYSCKMWFEDGNAEQLHVRGFIGVSILGRSEVFTRATSN